MNDMERNGEIFDALTYFETLAKKNRLCVENGFKPVFCSGPDSIEGLMQEFQKTANFVMIDDTTDQNLYSEGVSYFKRRVYTVFVLAAYRWDDMEDREEKLNLCRRIFHQFVRRMIWDKTQRENVDDDITCQSGSLGVRAGNSHARSAGIGAGRIVRLEENGASASL